MVGLCRFHVLLRVVNSAREADGVTMTRIFLILILATLILGSLGIAVSLIYEGRPVGWLVAIGAIGVVALSTRSSR